jgi:hypothetical protein
MFSPLKRLSIPLKSAPPPPEDDGTEVPPPPPPGESATEFHLPETNLFGSISSRLEAMEHPPRFRSDLEPILAVLVALVLGAFLGFVVSLAVNRAIAAGLGNARWLLPVFISPLFEEGIKALCIVAVALGLPRVFPTRRYSVVVGGAVGLGFGVLATIVTMMMGDAQGFNSFARLIATPVTQPLFSAFMGIGILVWLNGRSSATSQSVLGLPALFAVFALVSHMLVGAVDFAAAGGIGILVAAFTICPLFIFLLRDFLGGHLNVFHFLESTEDLPETPPAP